MYANKKIAVVSCVNKFDLFKGVQESLSLSESVYLHAVDNTSCQYSIPSAYNAEIERIDAELFVFIHQDVILPEHWIETLLNQIVIVEKMDKNWGVLGIMGLKANGCFAGNIIDPHTDDKKGRLPSRVLTLDEVCLVIRKSSGLRFDETTGGFHFYGADLCLQAKQKDMRCYAIDACLTHLSGGNVDDSFVAVLEKYKQKWSQWNSCPAVIETTCGVFQIKKGFTALFSYSFMHFRRRIRRRFTKWKLQFGNK